MLFHLYHWHLKEDSVCASVDWLAGNQILTGIDDWSLSLSLRNLLNAPESATPRPYFICSCGDSTCDSLSFSLERQGDRILFQNITRPPFPPIPQLAIPSSSYDGALARAAAQLAEFEEFLPKARKLPPLNDLLPKRPLLTEPKHPWKETESPERQDEALPYGFSTIPELLSYLNTYPWKQEDLFTELHSLSESRRFLALRLLYFLQRPHCFPTLYPLILDGNPYVRIACAQLLHRIGFYSRPIFKDVLFVLQSKKRCRRRTREAGLSLFFSHPFYLGLQVLGELPADQRKIILDILAGYPPETKKAFADEVFQALADAQLSSSEKLQLLRFLQFPAASPKLFSLLTDPEQPLVLREKVYDSLRSLHSLPESFSLDESDPLHPLVNREESRRAALALGYLAAALLFLLLLFFFTAAHLKQTLP